MVEHVDLSALRAKDAAAKGGAYDDEAAQLCAYAEDTARSITLSTLRQLGMGPSQSVMPYPPDISLMRWIVQRLSVAYLRPPSRWLSDDGERLLEESDEHQTMLSTLGRSQYDGAWQAIDEMRALLRSAVVRLYAVDSVGRVELRVFGPHQVHRWPDAEVPHLIQQDHEFALKLSEDHFEHWSRDGESWRARWVDSKGYMLPDQPFGDDGWCPYDRLPVSIISDCHHAGRAYLPLRTHRLGALRALSAISAELLEMIRLQGHSQKYWAGVSPNELARQRGMSTELAFQQPEAKGEVVNADPKIEPSLAVAKQLIVWLLASEELPLDALSEGRTILTGAALRVSQAGLRERRERLAQVAASAEPDLFARFRAVHNAHAYAWAADPLSPYDLEVELAPLSFPSGETEALEAISRRIALGLSSRVDAMCELDNLSRASAIARIAQIDRDRVEYPTPIDPSIDKTLEAGPRTASAPDAVLDIPGAEKASVLESISEGGAPPPPSGGDVVELDETKADAMGTKTVALNGAQVDAAKAMILEAAAGQLPLESAKAMLIAFYGLSEEQVDSIMRPLVGFTPSPTAPSPM
jgi:hypothetical protein